jgi:hypothetical protein
MKKFLSVFSLLAFIFPSVFAASIPIAGQYLTSGQILVGVTGAGPKAKTLQGTSGQLTVTNNTSDVTLSLPTDMTVTNLTVSGTLSPWTPNIVTSANGFVATYGVSAATAVITNTDATALTVGGGITAGTGSVGIVDTTGKIPALSSTYFASLAGTNLTGIPPAGITGTAATLGGNSFTAAQSVIGGVGISTSATSSLICHYKGAYVSLPTTGATECDTAYQISDHTLYVATKTVSAATDWKSCW